MQVNDLPNIHFKQIATPFYYYDLKLLNRSINKLSTSANKHQIKVHYALKANNNIPILNRIASHGFGADCVSGAEIQRALETGFKAGDIVFAGVGKTDEEIQFALKKDISCFNCESIHELKIIDALAAAMNTTAPIALRINPDHVAKTHSKITTGTSHDKFGIPCNEFEEIFYELRSLKHIKFKGLHFHIGSQIMDLSVFASLAVKINKIQHQFIDSGFFPQSLNLGGGLGIDYQNPDNNPIPDFEGWLRAYMDNLEYFPGQEISIEPGRSLVAASGALISKVLYTKKSVGADFAIVDAGMNDLIRPALYGANHQIENLNKDGMLKPYHVAGPVCESSDIFGKNLMLSEISRGDLLVIKSAGAYGEVMASAYNLRTLPNAVYAE